MKVKALKKFEDLKESKTRNIGDEFIVNKERFAEIDNALPGFIEEIQEDVEPIKTNEDVKSKK